MISGGPGDAAEWEQMDRRLRTELTSARMVGTVPAGGLAPHRLLVDIEWHPAIPASQRGTRERSLLLHLMAEQFHIQGWPILRVIEAASCEIWTFRRLQSPGRDLEQPRRTTVTLNIKPEILERLQVLREASGMTSGAIIEQMIIAASHGQDWRPAS